MFIEFIIWGLIFAIGVSDAQGHRIPNQLVIALMLVVTVCVFQQPYIEWWSHLKGFLVTFGVCFGFYLIKAMAGGDVKLLAVLGFWFGAPAMLQVAPYIVFAGGVLGMFYLALHVASSQLSFRQQVTAYVLQKFSPGWKTQQPLAIPFAPAIVIGVAYYFYVN